MAGNNPDKIESIFLNSEYPKEGLIAVKLFVKGKPEIITLDDYLPFYSNSLYFGRRGSDGSFWGAFLEKALAKLNGNYEAIGAGWQSEMFRILNGAPSRFYMMSSVTASSAWSIISQAVSKGHFVGIDTSPDANLYGIARGHAYSVIGTYELKDSYGRVVHRLYRLRNPWGHDSYYTGPWNDDDSRWTSQYRS